MLGAIIGDIVGSVYEFNNIKTKEFPFFGDEYEHPFFTDDTVMSLSIAMALLQSKGNYKNLSNDCIRYMQYIGQKYPFCGYGGSFYNWIFADDPQPYNSYGNGSAMRVSACGFVGKDLEEVKDLSRKVTEISHNHPEGLKGAEATAVAIYLAREGKSIKEIKDYITQNYYKIDFTLDEIRPTYRFNEICQDTVPQALEAFFESTSYEDAIRNAISIGGDSDTLGAITGGIAEAYYGIPKKIREEGKSFLDDTLKFILEEFEDKFPPKII